MANSGSLRSSASWLGNHPKSSPPRSGYNTVSGATNSTSARRGRLDMGVFDEKTREEQAGELDGIVGLDKADEGWHVSLSKSESRSRSSKKRDASITVYVSTPTASLTLMRTASELVDFEARLRSLLPGRLPPRKATSTPFTPPATPRKRSSVLASLQRTLSPRRGQTSSLASLSAKESKSIAVASIDYHELGTLLSTISHDSVVRSHTAWRSFFVVRKEDLQSARVEKRIKRTKSDATTHLAPPRASSDFAAFGVVSPSTGLHPIEGSSSTDETSIEVDTTGAQHLSLFPLPIIPSSKLDFQASDHTGVSERRVASSSTDMTDGTTSTDAAAVLELPTPPPIARADPIATAEVVELPSRPRTAPAEDEPTKSKEDPGPRGSRRIEVPTPVGATLEPLKSPARSRAGSKSAKQALTIDSFEIMRVLGKGCAGKVLLVKQKDNDKVYALKAIHKQHVLAHRELAHTKTEQAVLKACSRGDVNPFVVKLHYSFHDQNTLYLALDFHPGGDLATQLARWGRLGRDRARFYAAEIVEGVEGLHKAGIIYRDLKPENILIAADGHIVLTDFGLSKDFGHAQLGSPRSTDSTSLAVPSKDGDLPAPRPHWLSTGSPRSVSTPPSMAWLGAQRETTSTFCGTAEYLAPEVLLGEPYSYEVDAWSLGTILYEMLAGLTPFWSEDHATMYRRVLHDELVFDDTPRVFDNDTKSLLRGLLQRNPLLRMTDERMKRHPYFAAIDWDHVLHQRYVPPFIPTLNPEDPTDTSQFDDVFLTMEPQVGEGAQDEESESKRDPPEGEPQEAFDQQGNDVFDGYSYYGRDSDSIRRHENEDSDEEDQDEDEEMTSIHQSLSVDVTMELDDGPAANANGTADNTVSTFDSFTTDATTAMDASPLSKRARQHSEDQELGSLSGSTSLPSLTSASQAVPAATSAPASDIILEDVNEEEREEDTVSDSDWDVVGEMETDGAAPPLPLPSSRNGGKEATLWARGFKDKYRLVISPPRGASSPLRPPMSRNGSRKGSSTVSARSSVASRNPSPATTPEPTRQHPIRRLASVRSSSSNNVPKSTSTNAIGGSLRTRASHRSLKAEDAENDDTITAGGVAARGVPPSPSMSALETPRKAGQAIKRLTLSAFRPSSSSGAGGAKTA